MGYFNIKSIYMRLRRNAQVTPAEVLILVKDMDLRLSDMEGKSNETRVEEPTPTRRRPSKVSKTEVSAD